MISGNHALSKNARRKLERYGKVPAHIEAAIDQQLGNRRYHMSETRPRPEKVMVWMVERGKKA